MSQPASSAGELSHHSGTGEPRMRHPIFLLSVIAREMWHSRYLAWEILRRNIASQYRQSFLGVLLAFVPPLVITIWCTLINHAKVINIPSLELPYPAFVLMSMMLWTTFVEALYAPITGLSDELRSLSKASFPAEAVVLAHTGEVLFHFMIKLILIVGAIVWFSLPVTWTATLAPLGLILLIMLGVALGMILAPLNALYRDISKSLGAITTFWLFLTPVLFPVPTTGIAAVVVRLNPVTPLLVTTRDLVTFGNITDPVGFICTAVFTVCLFVVSCIFFRVALPIVIDRTNT
ncbi:MAG: ABC transporter permease [Planctomycetota bacterium]